MKLNQEISIKDQYQANPAIAAGLEVGLLGAVLALIEQVARIPLDTEALSTLFCSYRILVWIGIGALAVFWLKVKGSIEKPKQRQAGILAGLLTGLATGILMVVFSVIKSEPIDSLDLPEYISPEFLQQAGVVLMICCYGVPTLVVGTAFSYAGSLLMGLVIGSEKPSAQPSQPIMPTQSIQESQEPNLEKSSPLMLEDFIARRELPKDLEPALEAFDQGNKTHCRALLERFLEENPRNEQAWLWMAVIAEDISSQREYVERALEIVPGNINAIGMLNAIKRASSQGL